jgi:hypothetical protein
MADEKKVAKKTRTVKPVYAIMSVTDSNGNALDLTKENVIIHSVEKDAEAVLGALETGSLPAGSFYKRIALA